MTAAGEEPTVKVSLSTIYTGMLDLKTDLAEVKGALNLIAVERRQDKEQGVDHETRLRDVESNYVKKADVWKWITLAVGMAAIASAFITAYVK